MPPKVIQYRAYKKSDYATFNNNLCKQTKNLNFSELDFATLRKIFIEILDKFAPLNISEQITPNFLLKNLVKLSCWDQN